MARKFLLCFVAIIVTLGMVIAGCGEENVLGDPVTLNVLIRSEDERMEIGDYTANELENLGFTVTRQYGTGGELSPVWLGDPELGLWHAYTGGWVSTAVERDAGTNFGFFYTALGAAWMPVPLWLAYDASDEFFEVSEKLWTNDFSTPAEREALFEDAMWMSMNDSVRIMLLDRTSFSPLQVDTHLAADAYGGIYGSWLWALTVHFRDGSGVPQVPTGNTTCRASTVQLFVDPWNPVAGSNWAYDMFPIRATGDNGFEFDPNTGLQWPHRVVNAEVTWVDGLPIVYDAEHTGWLTTDTVVDPIPVPGTAWADFDAVTGEFLTTAEVFGNVTALTKTVVRYPDDIFTVPLHDGSTLDKGDFLLYAIMLFDRANLDSPWYDESWVPWYNAFMSHFKGVEFDFSPGGGYGLEITTYDDQYYLDAELIAGDSQRSWFPADTRGPWAWHTIALGMLAERDLALAFSDTKSDTLAVEWTSFIDGPSLPILKGYLDDVRDNTPHTDYRFLPYPKVLGTGGPGGIDSTAIDARYDALDAWYTNKGHFWVASGPYYLEDVDTLGNVIELGRHTSYPDDGTAWFFTMTPEPTTPPVHDGGWMDVITIEVNEQAVAVTKLGNDELDVFAFAIADADLKDTCDADADIWYYESAGSFNDLTFNPSGPFFSATGKLNPFALPAVRQAMNWAIERDYICGTIMSGMAIPRFNAVGSLSGDGVKYADILDAIDLYYAYNFATADEAIEAAMLGIPGVSRDVDGKYYYATP